MKKLNLTYILLTALVIISLGACKKDQVDPGGTATKAMANEWWVQIDGDGDYYHFATYNTSSNSTNEMILDDYASFWGNSTDGRVAGKIKINLTDKTFSATNSPNLNPNYDVKFTVKEGKIIPNGAKGVVSKAVTDSITFKIEFSDDPGTVYNLSGYARTRFGEDDH